MSKIKNERTMGTMGVVPNPTPVENEVEETTQVGEQENAGEQEQEVKNEPKLVLLSREDINQWVVSVQTINPEPMAKPWSQIIAEDTLKVEDQFWSMIETLPWNLILMPTDVVKVSWRALNEGEKPKMYFVVPEGGIFQLIACIQQCINSLIVYHKHREWVKENYSWTAKNHEQIIDLLTRLNCMFEQLIFIKQLTENNGGETMK